MKKSLTLIIAILIATQVFAQKLPEKRQFNYKDNTIYLENHPDFQYPTDNFFLGFHWSWGKYMNKALGMNTIHDMIQDWTPDLNYPGYKSTGTYPDSSRLIILSSWISHQRPGWNPREARALHYNPVIQANELTDTLMDVTNGFLGFKYIAPTATKSGRSLYLDSITTDSGLILSDNFLADRIEYQYQSNWENVNLNICGLNNKITEFDLNSDTLYFSINLRRTYLADNLFNSDTVLIVRLKYVTTRDTNYHVRYDGYVKFNTLPDTIPTAIDTLPNERGLIRKTIDANNDTYLVITRAMLPPANANEKDITITAKMLFNSPSANPNNYYFEKFNYTLDTTGQAIDSLKIEVAYTQKFSCALNWLRIETRPAMDMYQGMWDSLLVTKIQMDINGITADSSIYTQHNITPFRWYVKDEYGLEYWATNRYFNKLIGPVFTTEKGPEYSKLYESYFGNQEHWYAMFSYTAQVAVPYAKYAYLTQKQIDPASKYYLGLYRTYFLEYDKLKNSYWDIAANTFENIIHPDLDSLLNCSDEVYYNAFYQHSQARPVAVNEQYLYRAFVIKSNQMLFNDKPWWGQYFQLAQADLTSGFLDFHNFRPKTGEEIRSWINTFLILGAKGIFVDGVLSSNSAFKMSNTQEYLEDSLNITDNDLVSNNGYDFLERTDVFSDYLTDSIYVKNSKDSTWNLGDFYDLDLLSQYLGVDRNHIYVGCRSSRLEVKKAHDIINSNSQILTKLKLQEWLGKGYRKWDLINPKYNNVSKLSEFINIDFIKTRPIGRIQDDVPLYEQHATIDSGFYDLTLLAQKDDSLMNNSFYIGVLNRRLDPLIYITEIEKNSLQDLPVTIDSGYNFVPTADFDDYCDGTDSSFWRSKWWKRLGAREITIPFAYQNTSAPGQNYILKIEELKDSIDYNDNWSYWRKEKWNRKVDTLIMDDANLVLNLLPGEGRILKVTVLPKIDFPGELETSSQNKMVVYPAVQTSQKDFSYKDTSVYYHIVYEKYDSTASNYNVYYRRSLPTDPSNKGTNILWEPTEYKISNIIRVKPSIESSLEEPIYLNANNLECKFPSITVRYNSDSNQVMAYVVYSSDFIEDCDTLKNLIIETAFPANYAGVPSIPDTSEAIAFAYHGEPTNSNTLGRWGIPTINASYNGNYYSWADSIRGIMAGWKALNDRDVIIKQTSIIGQSALQKMLNPNLNTYSRMPVEENSCSLVWEGDGLDSNNIYYTRVKLDVRGNVTSSIYPERLDTTIAAFNSSERLGNYAVFYNFNTKYPKFPVVHKPVAYKLRDGYEYDDSIHYAGNGWDKIVFMDDTTDQINKNIYITSVDYSDILQGENHLPFTKFTSYNGRLIHPFIAQGNVSGEHGDFHDMVGKDSSLVITFTQKTSTEDKVYQYNTDFWSSFLDPNTWDWTPRTLTLEQPAGVNQNYLHELGCGIYAHPATSPISYSQNDFWLTRTVFESNKTIKGPTAKLMYKGLNYKKVATEFIGFTSQTNDNYSSITPILLENGNYLPINYGKIKENKKLNLYDTLTTDYIKIQDIIKLGFTYYSDTNTSFKMYIQKQSDKSVTEISPKYVNKNIKINRITCINGRNDNYRFLFVKRNDDYVINKTVVIGYEDEFLNRINLFEEELYKQNAEVNNQIINLNPEIDIKENKLGMSVYPNPANDELYIVCYLPRTLVQDLKSDLILKLFDNLGREVFTKEIKAGQIIRIPTDNLQTGSYYVKAFQNNQTLLPAEVKNVIIER